MKEGKSQTKKSYKREWKIGIKGRKEGRKKRMNEGQKNNAQLKATRDKEGEEEREQDMAGDWVRDIRRIKNRCGKRRETVGKGKQK